jgi:dihydroorotate dehydrogenase electron transfer subunit
LNKGNTEKLLSRITAEVISCEAVNAGYYLMWLTAAEIAPAAEPGQFVMIRCGGDTILPRPLSIHRREGDRLALLFQKAGKGTEWLSCCQSGDSVEVFGPLGNGYSKTDEDRHILLVSGGIGLAPMAFLADNAVKRGHRVTLLQGARTQDLLYPADRLPAGIELVNVTEVADAGRRAGMVTEAIPEYLAGADRVYACGPLPMYRTMAAMTELAGRPVQVSLEVRMGCGLGVCYGCTVKTIDGLKQVCKDGPVFDLHRVRWESLD